MQELAKPPSRNHLPNDQCRYTGKDERLTKILMQHYLFKNPFYRRRSPSSEVPPDGKPKQSSSFAVKYCLTDLYSMQFFLELISCLVFLLAFVRGLPIPSKSNIASSRTLSLVHSHRGLSGLDGQESASRYSHISRPQIWGGTPANTSICRHPTLWAGKWWWIFGSVAMFLVALYCILAFVMWGILSVDISRLTIWSRIGNKSRR